MCSKILKSRRWEGRAIWNELMMEPCRTREGPNKQAWERSQNLGQIISVSQKTPKPSILANLHGST